MVNNDDDKCRSFPPPHPPQPPHPRPPSHPPTPLYNMILFRHRTCTYLHGRADGFLVSVSNGQVAALGAWAYYQYAFVKLMRRDLRRLPRLVQTDHSGVGLGNCKINQNVTASLWKLSNNAQLKTPQPYPLFEIKHAAHKYRAHALAGTHEAP